MTEKAFNPRVLVDVFKFCCRHWIADQGWDTEEFLAKARVAEFHAWCQEHEMPRSAWLALSDEDRAKLDPEWAEVVEDSSDRLFQNDLAVALPVLVTFWSQVLYGVRPPLDSPIESVTFDLEVRDQRGHAFHLCGPMQFSPNSVSEGFVISAVEQLLTSIIGKFRDVGVGALMREHGAPAGPKPESPEFN